ncbi:hypothetical protein [Ralstonia sp. CP]|uniref:hypothetical protein n=1 Tax=Ralstonia sp. CP TaxID=3231757 RepID=UPI00345C5624
MTPQQQAAIARCCDHENLVGELVEHLRSTAHMLQATCLLINDKEARAIALDAVRGANALIAKAQGAQS